MIRSNPRAPVSVEGEGGSVKASSLATGLARSDYNLPFFHYLTIPINTTQADPTTYNLDLPIGIIHKVWVEFPRGCSGLAGLQVYRGVTQIFPLPAGVWLRSDNAVLNFALTHEMTAEPNYLELRGYNLDDTYSHTIWIGFEMRGKQSDIPPQLAGLLNLLKG